MVSFEWASALKNRKNRLPLSESITRSMPLKLSIAIQRTPRAQGVPCIAQECSWARGKDNDERFRGGGIRHCGFGMSCCFCRLSRNYEKLLNFQIQKGSASARSDDTKSLKSVIIDWLVPAGEALIPPIARNIKIDRGFNHEKTGALLCPAGVDWSDLE